jgi:hypothetical protein
MTIVLVHGVPETAAVWDPLRADEGRRLLAVTAATVPSHDLIFEGGPP